MKRVGPVEKAMEVLEMLTKNDREWFEYQAHLMAVRDEKSRVKGAWRAGELIGRIHLCQRLLKQPMTPSEDLMALSVEEIRAMATALQTQLGVTEN